jgi:hypothetical protein
MFLDPTGLFRTQSLTATTETHREPTHNFVLFETRTLALIPGPALFLRGRNALCPAPCA